MNNAISPQEEMETLDSCFPLTLVTKIMFCENVSIQGYIQWIEQEKTVPFRSFMELSHLLEEAVKTSKRGMVRFRSW